MKILYILISIALIIHVAIYRVIVLENHSVPQVIARINGMLVHFSYAPAISLMLKQTMTIIRCLYYLRLFIPVDDHIDAHRLVGTMIFISAINLDGHSWFSLIFTTAAGIGWPIFILLVLHAPNFWKWAIGPMVLFCFEKIYLFKRHLPKYGCTKLISIRIQDKHPFTICSSPQRKDILGLTIMKKQN
ncbi:unnamed protein product [Adineta steineri]|uniref:Uncharacterized protein n=1 Tax=Adineta steineri TaxID=433720 RepID=A0A813THN4_9BILA|nr:unnamed protein product [Adineta steineri]CAF0819769.1 unnamed protein product [Adineta steineri]